MTDSIEPVHEIAERIATSVRGQLGEHGRSRRKFLNRSALAGGGILAVGGTGVTLANGGGDDEEENGGDDGKTTSTFDDVEGTDVDVLNYALTLEHLENTFYEEVLDEFDEDDYIEAVPHESAQEHVGTAVYELVQVVGEHESAHVDVITQAVELLGGDPVSQASYNFGVESIEDVLATAQALENTGVSAYAGAAPHIESPDLMSAALSIHSVEARHAAFFNALNMESPFPNAFDPALSQDEVLEIAGQFIESSSDDDEGEDA